MSLRYRDRFNYQWRARMVVNEYIEGECYSDLACMWTEHVSTASNNCTIFRSCMSAKNIKIIKNSKLAVFSQKQSHERVY